MSAYCIFDILEITDPAAMETYRKRVADTVHHFGGRYVVRGGKSDVVEGNPWRPTFPVILEFPNLAQAHRWYDSEEYRELKELRLAATRSTAVFIEGLEKPV